MAQLGVVLFDGSLNTHTGVSSLLDHFHPDHTIYEASGWTYLPRVLRPWEVSDDDVFLDLGCGRGRVLYMAARYYRLRRIVGVDISAELTEHARLNIEQRRERLRTQEVEIVCANAREWTVPDDVTLVYLYFPFSGETWKAVVGNLVASLDRSPRRMRIFFAAPKQTDALLATGRFRLLRTSRTPGDYVMSRIAVYESILENEEASFATRIRRQATAAHETARQLLRTRTLFREGGLKRAHAELPPLPVERSHDRIVRATLRVGRASCLERSLILQAWHAQSGELRDVVIGVTAPGDEFGAHAWLDGLEPASESDFHELRRLAPRAPQTDEEIAASTDAV
jgi:SAM-dependent methyltransferase